MSHNDTTNPMTPITHMDDLDQFAGEVIAFRCNDDRRFGSAAKLNDFYLGFLGSRPLMVHARGGHPINDDAIEYSIYPFIETHQTPNPDVVTFTPSDLKTIGLEMRALSPAEISQISRAEAPHSAESGASSPDSSCNTRIEPERSHEGSNVPPGHSR